MKKSFLLLMFSFAALYVSAQTRDLNYFISEGLKNSPLLKEYHIIKFSNYHIITLSHYHLSNYQIFKLSHYHIPILHGVHKSFFYFVKNNGAYRE